MAKDDYAVAAYTPDTSHADYQPEHRPDDSDPVARALEYAARNWKQGSSSLEMVRWAMSQNDPSADFQDEKLSFKVKDPPAEKADYLATFSAETAYQKADLKEQINIHLASYRADRRIADADQQLNAAEIKRDDWQQQRLTALTELADTVEWNKEQLALNKQIADWTAQEATLAAAHPDGYQAATAYLHHGKTLPANIQGMPEYNGRLADYSVTNLLSETDADQLNLHFERYTDNLTESLIEARINTPEGQIVDIESFHDTIPNLESHIADHVNLTHDTIQVLNALATRDHANEGTAAMVHVTIEQQLHWEQGFHPDLDYAADMPETRPISDALEVCDLLHTDITGDSTFNEEQQNTIIDRLDDPQYLAILNTYLQTIPRQEAYAAVQQASAVAAITYLKLSGLEPDDMAAHQPAKQAYATAILKGVNGED